MPPLSAAIRTALLVLPLLTLAPFAAHADTTLSNSSTGGNGAGTWGGTSSGSTFPSFGQTVTAPTGETFLTSFTFNLYRGPGDQAFRAYVYAWNGTSTTGSALFTSDTLIAPAVAAFASQVPVTIDTGSVAVTAGNRYALFFSTLQQPSSSGDYFFSYTPSGSAYTGGTLIYNSSGRDDANVAPDDLSAGGWGTAPSDLAFSATFTNTSNGAAAPEPASLMLFLIAGVPAVGLVRHRESHLRKACAST